MSRAGVGLLILACGVLAYVLLRSERETGKHEFGATTSEDPGLTPVDPELEDVPSPSSASVRDAQAPGVDGPSALLGIVVDAAGPVSGAEVSLTVLRGEDLEWEIAWHREDWGPLERLTTTTVSDPGGRFRLERPGATLSGAVVWVSHAGHLAGHILLPPDQGAWPAEVRIVLEAAPAMEVLVRGADGKPLAGARIEQFGLTPDGVARGQDGIDAKRARRFLARSAVTGADGLARLGAFPGEQVVQASSNRLRSVPWRGVARARIALDLLGTFVVGGRVSLPDWSHLDYAGERRITITAGEQNLWRSLHTIRAVTDGIWGPVELPRLDVAGYRIRLEGAPIIPVEVRFETPPPGAELTQDLVGELGAPFWIQVTDSDGEVIPEAVARVEWLAPDGSERRNFVERGPYPPGHPNAGMIGMWSVPRGVANVEASAPGFVSARIKGVATEVYEDGYVPLVLRKAARVLGKCLHNGEPVRDFEVITWQTSDRKAYTASRFFDREDGTFELDVAPEGDCWITASSGRLPGCDPKQIRTRAEGSTEVVLELPEPLRAVGQVLDDVTGEPLSKASVQLLLPGDVFAIAPWGDPLPVGPDGVFELESFRPGKNEMLVMAAGYSRVLLERTAVAGELLDWGVVRLARAQTLTIQLEDAGGQSDLSGIQADAYGEQTLAPRKSTTEGRIEFADVSAGTYQVTLTEPDDTLTTLVAQLVPGREWTIRHRIAGPNHLTVELLVRDRSELAGLYGFNVNWASQHGYNARRTVGPISEQSLRFEVEGIDADWVQAEVFDAHFTPMASASGTFSSGRLHLVLSLEGEPFVLEVLDAEGEPVGDVYVAVSDPQRPGFLLISATDSAGRCELKGLPAAEVRAHLRHGALGTHLDIPIDASGKHARVVLDASAAIEVRFADGELSLAEVSCVLYDPATRVAVTEVRSDATGRATLRDLGAGSYTLHASRKDCWPVTFQARADAEAPIQSVAMRRLGDLELRVSIEGGLPVSGLPLQLTSIEFGTSVQTWIDAGQVRPSGLVTDLTGRVALEGLPHGPYDWAVTLPDGQVREGELTVEPARANTFEIVLPQ